MCSISQELMSDPVLCVASGHTYERARIMEWWQTPPFTDPNTGVEVGSNRLLAPNIALRKLISEWKEAHPGAY